MAKRALEGQTRRRGLSVSYFVPIPHCGSRRCIESGEASGKAGHLAHFAAKDTLRSCRTATLERRRLRGSTGPRKGEVRHEALTRTLDPGRSPVGRRRVPPSVSELPPRRKDARALPDYAAVPVSSSNPGFGPPPLRPSLRKDSSQGPTVSLL